MFHLSFTDSNPLDYFNMEYKDAQNILSSKIQKVAIDILTLSKDNLLMHLGGLMTHNEKYLFGLCLDALEQK